jgi:hypothetical protein
VQLSRLVLDGPPRINGRPVEVRFDPHIALIRDDGHEVERIREALEALFQGSTDFGRAYLRIDGLEIDVDHELAEHLADHIGSRRRMLATGFAARPDPDGGRQPPVGPIALRSALEMLDRTGGGLDRATVEGALRAVLAGRRVLRTAADMAVVEATGRQAEARAALAEVEEWRASVEPVHKRSVEARNRARRRLTGPLGYRRYARAKAEELELLEAGDFASYEEFDEYAGEAEARHRHELEAADAAVAEAEAVREALDDGGSGLPESDLLTVEEFVLRLRLRQFGAGGELPGADRHSLHNALGVLMDLEHGVRHVNADQLLDRATDTLARIETERLRTALRREASAHAEPLPAVGTLPLVLDAPFADVDPVAAELALPSLDPYVGLVQLVVLRPDPVLIRWASTHGLRPGPPAGPPVDRRRARPERRS